MQKIATNLTILRQNKTKLSEPNPKCTRTLNSNLTCRVRLTLSRSQSKMMTSLTLISLIPRATKTKRLQTFFNWIKNPLKRHNPQCRNLTFSHLTLIQILRKSHWAKFRGMGIFHSHSTHHSLRASTLNLFSSLWMVSSILDSSSLKASVLQQWSIQTSISTLITLRTSICSNQSTVREAQCPSKCPSQCIISQWVRGAQCHPSTRSRKCRRSK